MNPNDKRLVAARLKGLAGTLTRDELKEAITLMIEGRECAHLVSARAKAAKAKPKIDTDALLGSLFE